MPRVHTGIQQIVHNLILFTITYYDYYTFYTKEDVHYFDNSHIITFLTHITLSSPFSRLLSNTPSTPQRFCALNVVAIHCACQTPNL